MGPYFILSAGLIWIMFCNLVLSKKVSMPNLDIENSNKKLSECHCCKILVNSFNHWIDKTSRGKFEGGDAAWEESKLKSYARSEIRLVEIQEGLCSELKKHQDQCYSIAEEAEQALEKWWFHADPSSDLQSWLCIDTLQDCCPQNHFGEDCEPCPLDSNNKLCAGHGRCDGEGTRMGSGDCVCHKGYTGSHCEECAKNYYREKESQECKSCHKACDGCSGEGAANCSACNPGWQLIAQMESEICVDINECSDSSVCKPNQYCINTEGSHTCKLCDKSCKSCKGPGESNCTSCESEQILWAGVCVDSNLRDALLLDALRRMALYFGLLLITLFICRTSRSLTSLVIIVIAVYIYFSEKSVKMSFAHIIKNIYFKNN